MVTRAGKSAAFVVFSLTIIVAVDVECPMDGTTGTSSSDVCFVSKYSETESTGGEEYQSLFTARPIFDENPTFFYIIGHSGGDPEKACENTIESTRLGLIEGMNAVEIDLSMSVDEVILLWHDPDPTDEWTVARRNGVVKNGLCQPKFAMDVHMKFVPYDQIKKKYTYVNGVTGKNMPEETASIPTFDEWLTEFANDSRIKLIWLDIKVEAVDRVALFTKRLYTLLTKYNVERKCLLNVYDQKLVNLYQSAMRAEGLDPRRIVADKAISSYFLGPDVRKYSSVSHSIAKGTCCATQNKPFPEYNCQEAFEKMVTYDVALRNAYQNFTGERIKILSWTINDEQTMSFLINIGADGVITNKPGMLVKVFNSLKGKQRQKGEKLLMANSTWLERCNADWLEC